VGVSGLLAADAGDRRQHAVVVPPARVAPVTAQVPADWRRRLRVLLVTDGRADAARLERLVAAALEGGVRALQLRERRLDARALAELCDRLLPRCEAAGALLFVNDRVDVAAAGLAHGAQVGRRSLPAAAARAALPRPRLLGVSVHSREETDAAGAAGADFALLAPVWPTASKPDASPLGPERAAAWTAAAALPLLWLGGVTAARAESIALLPAAQRPLGVAVLGAICAAGDPARAARDLVRAAASWSGSAEA
jgi:thiamine-phosphate pyrophosphorylase